MNEASKGVMAMVAACTIWGLSSIYYKALAHVPPIEVLAHRTIWSLVFFALILTAQGRLGVLRAAISDPKSRWRIALAALFISFNWFLFIWSIQSGKAVEASLGYYIFPLVAVLLGTVVFGERLSAAQCVAVGLAVVAVALLTAGLGVAPWVSLLLAASFGLYGVVKKGLDIGPVVSVTGEVLLLGPMALTVLGAIHLGGSGAFGRDMAESGMLAFSGLLTATPLILFSYAARRVAFATVGLVQYLNPTLQFLVATLLFMEPFTPWHGIAFAMIWTALAVFSVATLRQDRAARRAAGT
ncbi:EamA family transporter RarD [Roseovarius sp. SYSU LYC5161]|uniref:EamA family transporter RarD n=1 Tax=Roseovarius halophilus (ex Wu et al. 2025) TaxID=3376060 RepID=UPI0028711713|nr:EamA family transporter RarD [Roseovarius sp.]